MYSYCIASVTFSRVPTSSSSYPNSNPIQSNPSRFSVLYALLDQPYREPHHLPDAPCLPVLQ